MLKALNQRHKSSRPPPPPPPPKQKLSPTQAKQRKLMNTFDALRKKALKASSRDRMSKLKKLALQDGLPKNSAHAKASHAHSHVHSVHSSARNAGKKRVHAHRTAQRSRHRASRHRTPLSHERGSHRGHSSNTSRRKMSSLQRHELAKAAKAAKSDVKDTLSTQQQSNAHRRARRVVRPRRARKAAVRKAVVRAHSTAQHSSTDMDHEAEQMFNALHHKNAHAARRHAHRAAVKRTNLGDKHHSKTDDLSIFSKLRKRALAGANKEHMQYLRHQALKDAQKSHMSVKSADESLKRYRQQRNKKPSQHHVAPEEHSSSAHRPHSQAGSAQRSEHRSEQRHHAQHSKPQETDQSTRAHRDLFEHLTGKALDKIRAVQRAKAKRTHSHRSRAHSHRAEHAEHGRGHARSMSDALEKKAEDKIKALAQ